MKHVHMRHSFLLFWICASLISSSCAQEYKHNFRVRTGDPAPDFEIVETDGDRYFLSSLEGHVVLLKFTASWCGVCRREMPHIEEKIWQPGRDKGLKVIAIDRGEPLTKVKEYQAGLDISYPMALDPDGEVFARYAEPQSGVTRNVVIDKEGKIICLTRLFRMDEFNEMKRIIFEELEK